MSDVLDAIVNDVQCIQAIDHIDAAKQDVVKLWRSLRQSQPSLSNRLAIISHPSYKPVREYLCRLMSACHRLSPAITIAHEDNVREAVERIDRHRPDSFVVYDMGRTGREREPKNWLLVQPFAVIYDLRVNERLQYDPNRDGFPQVIRKYQRFLRA